MGTKAQRQNQHLRRLMNKITRLKKKGKDVSRMEKELAYCAGDKKRPVHATGQQADPRFKKRVYYTPPVLTENDE